MKSTSEHVQYGCPSSEGLEKDSVKSLRPESRTTYTTEDALGWDLGYRMGNMKICPDQQSKWLRMFENTTGCMSTNNGIITKSKNHTQNYSCHFPEKDKMKGAFTLCLKILLYI